MKKHFVASGIILRNKKILFIWHKKLKTWLFPGGHIEENELPDEAVKREIYEETGLDVQIIQTGYLQISTDIAETLNMPYIILKEVIGKRAEEHYHIDLIYLCKVKDEEVRLNESEALKYAWFGKEDLDNIEMLDNVRQIANSVFEREIISRVFYGTIVE